MPALSRPTDKHQKLKKLEEQKRTDVNTLGEFGLIEHLTKGFDRKNESTIYGVGDDAAVIARDGDMLTVVSTDMLMEGIHFDLAYTPLKHLGHKAISVNVSDIYAMNAIPEQVTVSIAISNRFSVEALEELYAGIRVACKDYNVDLVGGDTTSSIKGIAISVTAIGKVHKDKITYRNTAKPGDIICITGNVGAAYLGLQLLEREKQIFLENPDVKPDLDNQNYLVGRQLKPTARRDMIILFGKSKIVPTSMIDISDGVASELFHICKQSGVGAVLEENGMPLHPKTEEMAFNFKMDPATVALSGGEDYELLFTIKPEDLEIIKYLPDIYISGDIVEKEEGIKLHTKGGNIHDLKAQGWKHF